MEIGIFIFLVCGMIKYLWNESQLDKAIGASMVMVSVLSLTLLECVTRLIG